jgi:3-phosphoshikimate 1-carboxyvinyltransferase
MDVIVRKGEIRGKAKPPASKSYTHRAFIAASLSPSARVVNPLISEDTISTLNACKRIGAAVLKKGNEWLFSGVDGVEAEGYFNFANSGTTLRIFTGLLSLSPFRSVVDGDESLRKRPNGELVLALSKLGARFKGREPYTPPFSVQGVIKGGEVEIEAPSSQFVSSLLFALSLAEGDSSLRVEKVKSQPYIDVTLDVLRESGVKVEREGNFYHIPGSQSFKLRRYDVPADFSSASYLIAAGLIAGEVVLEGMFESAQGDRKIVDICKEMGGSVEWDKKRGVIRAERSELEGVEVDASDIPDLVPTIAVLAAVAKGKTRIYNAEHLRIKEIDRIEGIHQNLKALGVESKPLKDGLIIKGGKGEFRGVVDSFGDHRMALAFSLLGLLGEVKCRNAEVVSVSFPGYFRVLESLGASVIRL